MTDLKIKRVAILGAGVMGAQIAAHMVNCGVRVVLFDLPAKEGPKSANINKAIAAFRKQKPAPLADGQLAKQIVAANYDDDLALLENCDLIIEAIAEKMEWKKDLYDKIEPHVNDTTILASNTSGLSIESLATVLNPRLKKRFIGMHFFNPPRYMHLLEIIPSEDTDESVVTALEEFSVSTMGKGVVIAKDTPNFIGNRVGVFNLLAVMHHAEKFDIPFEVVDKITGKFLGRPKSGTYRTADVVGLDTLGHVIQTMSDQLTQDPWLSLYKTPDYIQAMLEAGALGAKTRKGIYINKGKQVFSIAANDYVDANNKVDEAVVAILSEKSWSEKIQKLSTSDHPQAKFAYAILMDLFHYCIVILDEIADTARDVDFAIRWGFGWQQGPFEIMQAIGWSSVAEMLQQALKSDALLSEAPLPSWASAIDTVHSDEGSYSPDAASYKPLSTKTFYDKQVLRENVAQNLWAQTTKLGATIFENDSARLWDAGDDVAVLTVSTKMGSVGTEVLASVIQACEVAEKGHAALVLWRPEAPFSVGANLKEAMGFAEKGQMDAVREMIADFQRASMALKHCYVPTVAAVQGMALGGGCEFQMHADKTVAAQESYIGLVEAGVGLLPAGAGSKEFALRAAKAAQGGDLTPHLNKAFQLMAMAKTSTSALDAKKIGLLNSDDLVIANSHELLSIAKTQAKALADSAYRPPSIDEQVRVAGRQGHANLMMQAVNMLEGHFISEHDYQVADRIAKVLTGGDVDIDTVVPQDWLLKLERDFFFELIETEKTQARIMHTMTTGKPLRN